jgi:branched-chain amino acid aminotransferase
VSLTEMYNADEVFCTGTMGEIAGVTMIDGRTIGDGRPGELTRRIARLYREHAAANGTRLLDEPGRPEDGIING